MVAVINAGSEVVRESGAIAAEIDGQIVALNIEQGVCYGLNSVASRIWQLIEKPTQISRICDTLTSDYDVDRATCETETIALVRDLANIGLAKVQAQPDG